MSGSPVLACDPTDVLTTSPLPQLRRLVVTVSDGEVVITGQVSSFYFKQLAQETLMPTLDGRQLLNRVSVVRGR